MSNEQEPLLPRKRSLPHARTNSLWSTLGKAPTPSEADSLFAAMKRGSVVYVDNGDSGRLGTDAANLRRRAHKLSLFSENAEKSLKTELPETWMWLTKSNIGHIIQGSLLLLTIATYALVPMMVSYSKQVVNGFAGKYTFSPQIDTYVPPLIRRDREIDFAASNWPGYDLDSRTVPSTQRFKASWHGELVLPESGEYSFLLHSCDKEAKLTIGSETANPLHLNVSSQGDVYRFSVFVADNAIQFKEGCDISFKYTGPGVDTRNPALVSRFMTLYDTNVLQTTQKGQPYLDSVPNALQSTFSFLLTICAALWYGMREGQLSKYLKQIFNLKYIIIFAPAAVGWSIADILEVIANSNLDPTTYVVLTQSRLVLTALCIKFMLGRGQSAMQWVMLASLTTVLIAYNIVDMTSGGAAGQISQKWVLGFCATAGKVILSVVCGVYGERNFKGIDTPFFVQIANILVVQCIAAWVLLPMISAMQGTPVSQYGLFTGPDGAWSYASTAVVAAYALHLWVTNLVTKRFDALVKNLCNAGASVPTYFIGVFVLHTMSFDLRKVLLILVVVMDVATFSMSRMQS